MSTDERQYQRIGYLLQGLILLLTISLLSGCAGFTHVNEAPRVNIAGIQWMESTLMEQRFEVKIRVQNRSQSVLDIEGLSCDLILNDKDFASGVSNQKSTIEPLSEAVLSVKMTSTLFGLIRQIQSLSSANKQSFRYELSGAFYTGNAIFGIPFSAQGDFDFTESSPGAAL